MYNRFLEYFFFHLKAFAMLNQELVMPFYEQMGLQSKHESESFSTLDKINWTSFKRKFPDY